MEALVAMTAIAGATSRLRILSLVLANDYRHPVMLHKAVATLDVLSEGRVELGLGTGWMADDYAAAGLTLAPAAVRVERLEEAISIVKGLFGPDPLTYRGSHYSITGLDGLPKPFQQPHPPLLIGGGGRKILELAGREADIVGVHASMRGGDLDVQTIRDFSFEKFDEKVRWVRAAAGEAGRPAEAIELQCSIYLTKIDGRDAGAGSSRSFASLLASDPGLVADSPAVLIGSLDQCTEKLQERRERLGFSYLNLGRDVRGVAPLVARLSGT